MPVAKEAVIDPWAGKSLGEASAPEGFAEFWRQQEEVAQGGTSVFLAQQDAVARRAEEGAGGGGRGRGGRGRGRRGFQRYNPQEPRAPRARPTHFVAIRLYSRMIRRNVEQMQRWFVDKDALFDRCVVPVRKLHSSLLLTSIPPDRRDDARDACHEAGNEIRAFLGDQPMKLVCSGVGCFNGNVLFARIRTEPHEMLQAIHNALSRSFARHGFPVLDESAKSWLADGEDPHSFKAHASFIKTSKALAHAQDHEKRQFKTLRVTSDDLLAWRDVFFGTQLCHEFELLDMVGTTRDGYYPCIQLERFHDRPVGMVAGAPAANPASTPLAAGPLHTACLRVECGNAGAGLELSACAAGYLIEKVHEWPGQPDLKEGDAIVGIGGELLLGLGEEELEKTFGEGFKDGAVVVVGFWEALQAAPPRWVRSAAERLLKPWQRALQAELGLPGAAAAAAPSEASETASLYTEGGTKLRGLRYQLRTKAPSFAPDPLNQPGGDPWAEAANAGYVHSAYTGWGTEFKKRRATKLDSSRFVRPAPEAAPRLDADGGCQGGEHTPLHRQLRAELHGARSHARVLEVADQNRTLLSLANRAAALSRLATWGWLPDSLKADQRLSALLADLTDDLDAAEEASQALPPALLSSVALALGRLGLRRPDLYRLLAAQVRRAGIWTFADNEAAGLLEGFSRSRLTDEVIFQDAARLVVARIKNIAPRPLATMLTAFACSNVATEHLFFVAGGHIVAHLKDFTTGLRAELADAFSRVRARHALLVEVLPEHFLDGCLADRRRCSIEALVKVFSAYVDARQELGPESLREAAAAALCGRRSELTARLMRQVLQAAARARWPNARLLQLAAEVAARDRNEWELDAMHECFDQLRVAPPAGFPPSQAREQRRAERERHRAARQRTTDAAWGAGAGDDERARPSAEPAAIAPQLRTARLAVDPDAGAGIEVFACRGGYAVDAVSHPEQQRDLRPGDVIVAVEGRHLVGLEEEEVEQCFGDHFRHGAKLVVGRLERLQQIPPDELRRLVLDFAAAAASAEETQLPTGRGAAHAASAPAGDSVGNCQPGGADASAREAVGTDAPAREAMHCQASVGAAALSAGRSPPTSEAPCTDTGQPSQTAGADAQSGHSGKARSGAETAGKQMFYRAARRGAGAPAARVWRPKGSQS